MTLAVCERFHCLPSQARAEGVEVLRLLEIEHHGRAREEVTGDA